MDTMTMKLDLSHGDLVVLYALALFGAGVLSSHRDGVNALRAGILKNVEPEDADTALCKVSAALELVSNLYGTVP